MAIKLFGRKIYYASGEISIYRVKTSGVAIRMRSIRLNPFKRKRRAVAYYVEIPDGSRIDLVPSCKFFFGGGDRGPDPLNNCKQSPLPLTLGVKLHLSEAKKLTEGEVPEPGQVYIIEY